MKGIWLSVFLVAICTTLVHAQFGFGFGDGGGGGKLFLIREREWLLNPISFLLQDLDKQCHMEVSSVSCVAQVQWKTNKKKIAGGEGGIPEDNPEPVNMGDYHDHMYDHIHEACQHAKEGTFDEIDFFFPFVSDLNHFPL
jgi:hypothetical protein